MNDQSDPTKKYRQGGYIKYHEIDSFKQNKIVNSKNFMSILAEIIRTTSGKYVFFIELNLID